MRHFTTPALAAVLLVSACATSNGPDLDTAERVAPTRAGEPAGPFPGSQEDFEEVAGRLVFFALDEYTLTPDAKSVLSRQAAWLQEYPETRVRVAGHCDERGTRAYNFALGARRAEVTKAYLVSMGVDPARIETVSFGKERPLVKLSTSAAWSKNRRADTQLVADGA